MKLPKKIRIGARQYNVRTFDAQYNTVGNTIPAARVVHVATTRLQKPRSDKAVANTFWHEVTHAILHDMKHPLWEDEKFVTDFSTRLAQSISSARFE